VYLDNELLRGSPTKLIRIVVCYNMKKISLILLSVIMLYSCTRLEKYSWITEAYEYTGFFDSTKYTLRQIEDTYELSYSHFGSYSQIGFDYNGEIYDLTEIRKLDIKTIEDNYHKQMVTIERIEPINNLFWENLKKKKIEELNDEYNLKLITVKSYLTPEILLDNKYSNLCPEYVTVINSNDTVFVLNEWEKLIKTFVSTESELPKKYMNNFNLKYISSREKFVKAKSDLITLGFWHNSCRKLAELNSNNSDEEFAKLFVKIRKKRW
jgi:hypothetical protein